MVVIVVLAPSANVHAPDVATTTPTVIPVEHGDVPPLSVTSPAVVLAQTVCPNVTAELATIGVIEGGV